MKKAIIGFIWCLFVTGLGALFFVLSSIRFFRGQPFSWDYNRAECEEEDAKWVRSPENRWRPSFMSCMLDKVNADGLADFQSGTTIITLIPTIIGLFGMVMRTPGLRTSQVKLISFQHSLPWISSPWLFDLHTWLS